MGEVRADFDGLLEIGIAVVVDNTECDRVRVDVRAAAGPARRFRTEGSGTLAYVYGRGSWVNGRPPNAGAASKVRLVIVWRKEADGKWGVTQEIFTKDTPDESHQGNDSKRTTGGSLVHVDVKQSLTRSIGASSGHASLSASPPEV